MANITLTQDEYRQNIFNAYKKGFAAAVETLKVSLEAIEEIRPTPLAPDVGDSVLEDSPFETGIRRGAVVIPPTRVTLAVGKPRAK